MDEVEWAIQGKVDNWRIDRRRVLLLGNFKRGIHEKDLYSLPYDDEYDQTVDADEIINFYNNAVK